MTTITLEELNVLERGYRKALEKKKDTFEFKGETLLVSYAKYLIEYLKGILNA